MPTERPILKLHPSERVRRIPGAPDRRRRPRETVETQTTRFGGEFERLSRTLDDIEAGVDIAAEPNRIVPDRVLVLELKNSVQNFAREARRLGFAWMLEQGADGNDNVSDEEDLVDPAVAADPRLYALMPSREALQTLLRLWTAFTAQEPAPQGYGKWWQIFATLNVIRSWSAEDRIDQWTRTILQDQIRRNPTGAVRIEFDLWFREDPIVRLARMEAFQAKVAAADGRVLDRVLLEPIQYHAALVELPVRQALALIERAGPLATADEVMVVRPQSFSPHPPSERDPLEAVDRALLRSPTRALRSPRCSMAFRLKTTICCVIGSTSTQSTWRRPRPLLTGACMAPRWRRSSFTATSTAATRPARPNASCRARSRLSGERFAGTHPDR
ncbi:hypothetical protein [Chenggangzhangella methanolivorans]|uniref:Uncharacterized protein n=1 Tax=Chenggangzhangella methanolivorans TaxID=1437009 RepID=A0A9E6UPZ7_9HYPH|nr:hypothetical protein [Chenggangzhangella methanolivorans]QZO01999.1 hypothetical protein K6K41_12285 [Chenggangzhangella methanolivorans]